MPGKTSQERRALEQQNALILKVFQDAGYDFIQPDILQPADVFLERSGEDIRTRTFVFSDPNGRELCLRPDLTVPTCRYHIEHTEDPATQARYCYCGPAFRYRNGQSQGEPSEFDQAGIEWFGATDGEVAETDVLSLAIAAVEAAGLEDYRIRLGDLGLFHAVLESIDMPERWRRRLRHQFWRPRAFRELLQLLTGKTSRQRTSISARVDRLEDVTPEQALQMLDEELAGHDLVLVGHRTLEDIADRLVEKAADRRQPPLSEDNAAKIDRYLAMRGAPAAVEGALNDLAQNFGHAMSDAYRRYVHRNELMAHRGLAMDAFEFTAVFGRSLEYYTGFVFQIEVTAADGGTVAVAGGGRYDNMLSDIGAGKQVPAVGCAVYTERLLALAKEGRG